MKISNINTILHRLMGNDKVDFEISLFRCSLNDSRSKIVSCFSMLISEKILNDFNVVDSILMSFKLYLRNSNAG
jgi:hypothetical protein